MRFGSAVAAFLSLASVALAKDKTTATTDDVNTSVVASLASTTSIKVVSGCSFSKTFTATAQADLDKLAGCEAVQGDILIQGDLGSASIANVKVIYGNVDVFNATNLVALTADSLTTITGELKFKSLTILSTVSFANLESVGAINWVTLPNLLNTGLDKVTECNSILVSDTQLYSLDGINPSNVEIFNINNNFNMGSISSNIETVSNALTVAFNGDDTTVEFDNLVWANNLTFYKVSSISMPNIQGVNKSAGFFESSVEELEFPLITAIGSDLTIENNEYLTSIDFSNVTSIGGGLVIANNTALESIENIDSIKTVQGAVILKGSFDNVTMTSLRTVRGAFDLETTGHADCTPFNALAKKGAIQGDFTCKAAKVKKSSSSSSGDSTSTTSKGDDSTSTDSTVSSISSKSSKGDAAGLQSSMFTTFAAIILALL